MNAAEFHRVTKHDPGRLQRAVRAGDYGMDWSNRPSPYKEYLDLEPMPLIPDEPDTDMPALDALVAGEEASRAPSAAEIARILHTGTGVIRTLGDREFRTYASAGALYPIEVYLAAGDIDEMSPGVYHYHPGEHLLRCVRTGDPMPWLARATGSHPGVAGAPAALVLSGIPWRTTWKYRDRGYRHLWWDAGTMLANVLALARAGGFPASVVAGFADAEVDALIGVDGREELSLAIVPLGAGRRNEPAPYAPEPAGHRCAPLSRAPIHSDAVLSVHARSSLAVGRPEAWRTDPVPVEALPPFGGSLGIEDTIRRRGSTRRFAPEPVPGSIIRSAVAAALRPMAADWGGSLTTVLVAVHGSDGMEPGTYRLERGALELQKPGDFRAESTRLCLGQPLGGDGAATAYLMCDLADAISRFGERGYRAAQLDAGIVAGRLMLAAYAQQIGATGLTFFDDEVRAFFGTDLEPMLVVALGKAAYGRRVDATAG